jgi:hypothetical protein
MTLRNSQFKSNTESENPQNGLSSVFIPWTKAEEMRDEYLDNPEALKIETPDGIKVLRSFRLEADQMQKLLEGKNESGVVVQAPASKITLMFGVREQDLGKPASEQYFTIIAAAVDAQNNLLTAAVLDNFSPCPFHC